MSTIERNEVDTKRETLLGKLNEVLREHSRGITGDSDAREMKSSVVRYGFFCVINLLLFDWIPTTERAEN